MSFLSKLLDPIFGSDTSKQDRAAADAINQQVAEYSNISLPELQQLNPEALKYQGDITPQLAALTKLSQGQNITYDKIDPRFVDFKQAQGTAFDQLQTDPRLKSEQLKALDALSNVAQSGGLTAADRANLAKIQSETSQADRGRREAILQNMAQRGMGGSGLELLSQLQSSQAAADRASQQGMDVAGMAQQRALDALMQGGQLAGSLRGQDFGEQAQIANARDAIQQFNLQNINQQALQNANIANQMAAQNAANQFQANQFNANQAMDVNRFNVGNQNALAQNNANIANQFASANRDAQQNIANQNVANRNAAQQYNVGLPQQQFQNKMGIAGGKTGSLQNVANFNTMLGDRQAQKDAAYMNAAIQGATTVASQGMKK